jgi:hypothetical protein
VVFFRWFFLFFFRWVFYCQPWLLFWLEYPLPHLKRGGVWGFGKTKNGGEIFWARERHVGRRSYFLGRLVPYPTDQRVSPPLFGEAKSKASRWKNKFTFLALWMFQFQRKAGCWGQAWTILMCECGASVLCVRGLSISGLTLTSPSLNWGSNEVLSYIPRLYFLFTYDILEIDSNLILLLKSIYLFLQVVERILFLYAKLNPGQGYVQE